LDPTVSLDGAERSGSFDVYFTGFSKNNIDDKAAKSGMESAFLGNRYGMKENKVLLYDVKY